MSNIFLFLFFVSRGQKTKDWKAQLRLHPKMGREITHLASGQGFSLILKDAREKPSLSDLVFTE